MRSMSLRSVPIGAFALIARRVAVGGLGLSIVRFAWGFLISFHV
jgi:hypothetical protein